MIESMQPIFGSVLKSLDILYVLEDLKPTARIMASEESFLPMIKFLEKNKLAFEHSDFKVAKLDSSSYSDKGAKLPVTAKGEYFLYISKDKDKAKSAKELEAIGKHKELGLALGYPGCCSQFFAKHYDEMSQSTNDYTLKTLANSKGLHFPFYTNIAARHLDIGLLSHFPCNFNCEASIAQAKLRLRCIKQHSPDYALIIESMMKSGVIYSDAGAYFLRDVQIKDKDISYNSVIGTVQDEILSSLKSNPVIKASSDNELLINGLHTKNLKIMLFH